MPSISSRYLNTAQVLVVVLTANSAIYQHYRRASFAFSSVILILARIPAHLRAIYKVPQVGHQMPLQSLCY
jgi:hypothetical protein